MLSGGVCLPLGYRESGETWTLSIIPEDLSMLQKEGKAITS